MLLLFLSLNVLAEEQPESPSLQGMIAGDYVATGGHVEVASEVNGDVYAAGGSILIRHPVDGDVAVAGGNITLQGKVRDDVYAAGGSVVLDTEVGGDARLAGGHVSVTKNAKIMGKANLNGADVDVQGSIARGLQAKAETIRLRGEIQGDVDLTAHEIEVLPGARITGKLTYRSPQRAKIDPAAQISGGISYTPLEIEKGMAAAAGVAGFIAALLFMAGLVLLGGILLVVFSKFAQGAASTVGSDPGTSMALGFALLVAIPVGAILLFITIIGIPVGLIVILLYPIVLLLGYLIAVLYLAEKGLSLVRKQQPATTGWRFASFIVVLILLSVLQGIPVIGGVLVFFLLIAGLGAVVLYLYRNYARTRQGGSTPSQEIHHTPPVSGVP
ncbi:MAG: hypothetical protein IDH49_12230 [Gammaproteobacteria bacterium]|nr:hypothetical protein [Gammaproteobacteria bacterium]